MELGRNNQPSHFIVSNSKKKELSIPQKSNFSPSLTI